MKIFKEIKFNRGMTYVELIVVLGIFSVLSSVSIYNYGAFQDRIDIKNLSSDIALKIVEAQKSAMNGVLPTRSYDTNIWKPSYGIYFDVTAPKQFIYFVDLDNSGFLRSTDCAIVEECLDLINITKNNYIDKIEGYLGADFVSDITSPISIFFKRPGSGAFFSSAENTLLTDINNVRITIESSSGATSIIKIYTSGRIQID